MFASRGCGDLPCRLRPVFIYGNGVSPGVHAYRGGGGVFALHFSCTGGACAWVGLRPAGRRVRGCIARGQVHAFGCVWGVLRVRVGCRGHRGRGWVCCAGGGMFAVGDRDRKSTEGRYCCFAVRSYLNFRHFTARTYLNFRNKIYRILFPRNIKLRSKNWFNVKRGRFLGRGFLRCRRVYRAETVR